MEPTAARATGTDRELAYRLGAVMLRCFKNDGGAALRAIDEAGVTLTQLKILTTLDVESSDAYTLRALAETLGISDAAASRAL